MELFTHTAATITTLVEPTMRTVAAASATNSSTSSTLAIVYLIVIVLMVVAYWRIFSKAGEAGWQSIIPIWSSMVLLKIVGRPMWWILLLLIPFVNIVVLVVVLLDLGKSFGKSTAFSILWLILFNLIGYFILGFGDDKYIGPGGSKATPSAS